MRDELVGRMRFRMLGPVEVRSGQRWQDIDDVEWRSLLSCLMLRSGELVSLENLAAAVWGDATPDRAGNLISMYVHRLRRLIGDPDGRVLSHQAPGYQLCIGVGELDLLQFEALVEDGRSALAAGNPGTAAVLLAEALGLWRGPALADVMPTAFLVAQAGRLAELRVTAAELRATADLACGRAAQVVPGLRQLVADNPSHEGLRLLLARALEPVRPAIRAVAEPHRRGPDTAATREDFGRALDAARTCAGLTVLEAARAAQISPDEAAGYFSGTDLPSLSEVGLKSFHAILGACGITDPGQVIAWTYALARSSSAPDPRLPPAGHQRETAAGHVGPGIIPDSPGFDLCPDPLTAQTATDLLTALSRFRIWAGEPSYQDMQRLSEPRTAASTMCTALGGSVLPSERVIRGIITGCGGTPEQLQAFITARRRIRLRPGPRPEPSANRTLYPVQGTGALAPGGGETEQLSAGTRNPGRRPA